MGLENFIILDILGKGSFGTVVKCLRKTDKEIYAMKQIDLRSLPEKDKKNALNEVRILASIHHEHIVEYKQAFVDERSGKLCVVMQFANGGDLSLRIKEHIKCYKRFSEHEILRVAYQCLLGLAKLHEINIIHRDIKSANIFFQNGRVKLGDLNVAKHLKDPFTCTQTGTPYYASPEVWNQMPYSFASDLWSLGCVLYEMAMLKAPFRAKNADQLYIKITSGSYSEVTPIYSQQLRNLIGKCLSIQQKDRATASQLAKMQIFDAFRIKKTLGFREISNRDYLLDTINFTENTQELNNNLPKAKYDLKPRTSKLIIENLQNSQQAFQNKRNLPTLSSVGSQKILSSKFMVNEALSPRRYEFKEQRKPPMKLIQIMSKQRNIQNWMI